MGHLVVIEALDAGGSNTQTHRLKDRLLEAGYHVTQFHFPQEDRATGQLIYEKFLHHHNKGRFTRREQALLYLQDFFSRAEEIWHVVKNPANQEVLLLDRFYTSTLAYQTIGLSGMRRRRFLQWLDWLATKDTPALPVPDLVLLLDTPVHLSLQRLAGRKQDFFEKKQKLTAVRSSYLTLAKERRWPIVSGVTSQGEERNREDIAEEVWQVIATHLK